MDNGDVISRLPRDLLISILSRLTFKEAMVTSVLSRPWNKLWTFYHGDMYFEVSKKLGQEDGCSNYVRSVDKTMDTLEQVESGAMLDSFTIIHSMCPSKLTSVDRWVQFALEKRRVKSLIFDCELYFHNSGCSDHFRHYDFPPLQFCSSSNIRALTSIRFRKVNVSGAIIESFLSNCPLLQTLELIESCDPLIHLRVSGALRHLLIHSCYDLTTVELSAPNLVSLTYKSEGKMQVKFDIGKVVKLVELKIGIPSSCPHVTSLACRLLTCFSHPEKVELAISCQEPGDLTKLPELTWVKHLTMEIVGLCCGSFLAWTPLLRAFPSLEKFTVNMQHIRDGRIDGLTEWHDTFTKNKHLKEFEFIGFGKSSDDIELVRRFLENSAGSLEKIVIHSDVGAFSGLVFTSDVETALRLIEELKRIIVPKEADLVIFEPDLSQIRYYL